MLYFIQTSCEPTKCEVYILKKKDQRINEIYSFLQESPSLSVKDLSEMLNVSEMTIRRDLQYLKENNLFVRSHGIQLPINDKSMITNIESEYTLHSEQTKFAKENRRSDSSPHH